MNKLPTAEEFYELNGFATSVTNKEDWVNLTKEFAKLHVKAALEAASENASISYDQCDDMAAYINTTSILNAYPLDQIK